MSARPALKVIRGGGGGGKGGGSSEQRTPFEAPNSLQSNSTARLVDLVSEGEIEGLVGNLKGVYFDNTPLQNPDGSFNFSGVIVDGRLGLPDQEPMPGFPAVESVEGVNADVTALIPITRTVTNVEATAARVTLQLAALVSVDTATGDRNPASVSIAIDVQPDGGVFTNVFTDTISGKTNSTYQRAYRFPLDGDGPWNVRVRRLSPDSTTDTLINATSWASLTVIEDYQFSYPNSALVGIAVDAKNFGNSIPARTYDIKGIRLQVPGNYDPLTRAYTGLWDGTFQTAWSDNPAWVFYDLITNTRYGLGQYIQAGSVDKFGLYAIAQYCDELVPDGVGGQEPRYTFNGVISTAAPALQVLVTLASAFRGMVYCGAVGVTATADMPVDPVKLVTPANVIDGMIDYSGSALKARHNFAHVSWYNPENGYKQDIEPVEGDPDEISRWGLRTIEPVAFGCTSRGQAHRFGRWILDSEQHETETASWAASWDHADVSPGDLVKIADPAYSGVEFGGRIASLVTAGSDTTGMVVDRPVTIAADQIYTCSMVLPDGRLAERVLSNAAGETDTLMFVDVLPEMPVIGALWVLSATNVEPRLFRVISRVETEKHLFSITALLHDPTKYDRIEQDLEVTPPSYTILPTGPLAAPTNIQTAESIALAGGSVARAKCTVSWTAAPDSRVVRYEVQQRRLGQDWEPAGFTGGLSIDLYDLSADHYGFRVRSVDALGRVSAWLTLEDVELSGLLLPPDDVANVRAENYVDENTSLSWDEVADYRPIRYAVRKGDSWESALEVGTVAHPPYAAHGNGTYWVKAYTGPDADRIYSDNATSVEIAGVALNRNVIAFRDEQADGWPGVFTGTCAVAGPSIRTGGSTDILTETDFLGITDLLNLGAQGNGAYEMDVSRYVNAGRLAPCRVTITWDGTASQVGQDILTNPDILNASDFLGSSGSDFVSVYPEVSVSRTATNDVYTLDPVSNPGNDVYAEPDIYSSDASFTPWIKYEPGIYVGYRFRARLVLETRDGQTIAYGLAFSMQVDVPDRNDSWGLVAGVGTSLTGITVPNTGLAIAFATNEATVAEAFNGGNGSDILPHVQITNGNGQTYDFTFDDLTLAGMTLYAKQGGVAVNAPKTNVIIQGY